MPKYFPVKETDKREWFLTFKSNFGVLANALGLSAQETADWDAKLARFLQHIDTVSQKEREMENAQRERDEFRNQEMPFLHQAIRHWKTHRAYTKAVGELLNIETEVTVKNPKTSSAKNLEVTIAAEMQKVSFKFKKSKKLMVAIYCKRGNESEFSLVRQILSNSYEDKRSNLNANPAERREYYFAVVKEEAEIDRSGVYTVAVAQ